MTESEKTARWAFRALGQGLVLFGILYGLGSVFGFDSTGSALIGLGTFLVARARRD